MDENNEQNTHVEDEIQEILLENPEDFEVTEEDRVKDLEERIAELERQIQEERDGKLRALADCQNIKARALRERQELISYAQSTLLLKILEVVDDFKNVLDANTKNTDSWLEGVRMVYQKLLDILQSEGVAAVAVNEGDTFDPTTQEAVSFVVTEDEELNQKVARVISQGYKKMEGDRVIKTAKVIVNKKS